MFGEAFKFYSGSGERLAAQNSLGKYCFDMWVKSCWSYWSPQTRQRKAHARMLHARKPPPQRNLWSLEVEGMNLNAGADQVLFPPFIQGQPQKLYTEPVQDIH